MNRRPTEPAGKPFLRVRLDGAPKKTKTSENRSADALQKGAIERGNREQARETKEMKMMKKPMKKYAKGGKIDGCATKGKTKTKMVKMAAGGSTGLSRAAAMSGRTMPTTGTAGRTTGTAKAAAMSGRTFKKGGSSCGTKKMAMGGMTGLDRAGAMSGRAMPTPGMGMRPELTGGGPAMMGMGRPDGYKKGGKTKGKRR